MKYRGAKFHQSGLSLVELLVATAISTVLLAGVAQLYVSNSVTYQLQTGSADVLENGRYAIERLRYIVRQSAYRADPTLEEAVVFSNTARPVFGFNNQGDDRNDVLRIRYQGADDETIIDCLGNVIYATSPDAEGNVRTTTAVNTFYVATGSDGEPGLFCSANAVVDDPDGTAIPDGGQEIVRGVERIQVLYGVDTDGNDGQTIANRYSRADTVSSNTEWSNVVSLRIGLLMRSSNDVRSTNDTNSYFLAGIEQVGVVNTPLLHPVDRRLRRTVNTTITLRNRTR